MTTRILRSFGYLEPATVEEGLSMLTEHGQKARILAGGTDLLVNMKFGTDKPDYILDMTSIPDLDHVKHTREDGLRIGALVTLRAIETSGVIRKAYPILAEAAKEMATVQIRNMATIGGNLCNASPAADMAPPLLVIDAKVRIVGPKGSRVVPVDEFFKGPGLTVMGPNEMLTEILAGDLPQHAGTAFLKTKRTAADLSKASVAVAICLANGICNTVRIALGAVASCPIRSKKAEKALEGKELDEEAINKAAHIAASETNPISDLRSTETYRRHLIEVLVRRALNRAIAKVR